MVCEDGGAGAGQDSASPAERAHGAEDTARAMRWCHGTGIRRAAVAPSAQVCAASGRSRGLSTLLADRHQAAAPPSTQPRTALPARRHSCHQRRKYYTIIFVDSYIVIFNGRCVRWPLAVPCGGTIRLCRWWGRMAQAPSGLRVTQRRERWATLTCVDLALAGGGQTSCLIMPLRMCDVGPTGPTTGRDTSRRWSSSGGHRRPHDGCRRG